MRFLPTQLHRALLLLACLFIVKAAHADVYRIDASLAYAGEALGPQTEFFHFDTSQLYNDILPGQADCGLPTRFDDCFIVHDDAGGFANSDLIFFRSGFVAPVGPGSFYPDLPGTLQFGGSGPFFTGTDTDPHIVTGTYFLSELETHSISSYGTATIIDETTSPVPEPSSLALMGTGILGGLAAVRRRFS